ncbi:MAG: ion transporter [Bdellovibrionales bacterium]
MLNREKLHEIIFEAETPSGKFFDVALLWAILASVFVVLLESVTSLRIEYGVLFAYAEWFFTLLFTLEYLVRIYAVRKPMGYIFSFYGLIDLLSIMPTYLSLYVTGAQSLLVIRAVRLLRVFRVLKLVGRYLGEAQVLLRALQAMS